MSVAFSERDYTILNALALNYASVYFVDFDVDEVIPYRISQVIEEQSGSFFRSRPRYWDAISSYIERNTAPEDKEEMLSVASYENLCRELSDKTLFMYDYRVFRDGKTLYFRMKVANVSKEEGLHQVVMGFADISTEKTREIERYAYTSEVTGGDNYIRFKEYMSQCDKAGFIAAMDIYSFKIVNSTCGVLRGDEALRTAWECVAASLGEDDFAGHINADHFVIFFAGADCEEANRKIMDITARLERASKEMEIPLLSPYYGLAEFTPGDDIEQIYGHATFAKHSIKGSSGINYGYFSQADAENALISKQMEDSFDNALENREFEVWYQPKYTPNGGALIGAEALVRWRRNGSLVPPNKFIPVFEKNGMIRRLDEYVFRTVCHQQKKWKEEGKSIIPISVNISRVSLYFQNIVEQYTEILNETGLLSKYVPLEITESAAAANAEIKALTDRFFSSGFALHMDDFGTGYSSLSSLNQLHFNTLKLDKSMVDYIGNYGGDKLLEHTIALAKDLGLHVTAEGVEKESQVNFLRGLRCDSIQGYYFSKPLPLEDFTVCLSEKKQSMRGSADRYNSEILAAQAYPIQDTISEALDAAADYAKEHGNSFVANPITLHESVYQNKPAFVSLLKNVTEFAIDRTPQNESIVFVCSKSVASEVSYNEYKFVVIAINACISAFELNSVLSADGRIAAAQKTVGEMGGSMTIEVQEEKDIELVIRLPFKRVRAIDTAPDFTDRKYAEIAAGKRVLLVEDNEFNRSLTVEILETVGFEVEAAEDGPSAVQAIMDNEPGCYSFVLMDVFMPRMNGYETAKQIRAIDREDVKALPIIAHSASMTAEDVVNSVEAGMNGYVSKPLVVSELFDIINKLK